MNTKLRRALTLVPLLLPAAAAAQTTTTIAQDTKPYSLSSGYFAAGYTYDVAVTATQASTGNSTYRKSNASAWASVFGRQFDFIRNESSGSTTAAPGTPSVSVTRKIYYLGILKRNDAATGPVAGDLPIVAKEQNLMTFSRPFNVGPVPMYVSVDVYADSHLRAGGTLDSSGGELYLRPVTVLGTEVSVGVGIDGVASAGVTGDLRLITIAPYAPSNARWTYVASECSPGTDKLSGDGSILLLRTVLEGRLLLFAEILWQRYEKEIFDYEGVHDNEWVYRSGTKSFSFPALRPAPTPIPVSCLQRPVGMVIAR